MIFAVRDRLRCEERHLGTVRERLLLQSRYLLERGDDVSSEQSSTPERLRPRAAPGPGLVDRDAPRRLDGDGAPRTSWWATRCGCG